MMPFHFPHFVSKQLVSLALLSLAWSSACSKPEKSATKGHFENYDEATLAAYKGQLSVVAEHDPSQGILMSYTMFTEHKREDMAVEFLNAGIDSLWVVVPFEYSKDQETKDLAALLKAVGSNSNKIKILRQPVAGKLREWARDFGPLTAHNKSGQPLLLDLNYYSDRPADDSVPQELARLMKLDRVSLPIYNEGGNFMNNSRGDCLMTERVLLANNKKEVDGDKILTKDEIISFHKDYLGCKTVHIFPVMPYEGTRHIDLWGKFLNDDTIIVADVLDRVVALPVYTDEQRKKVVEVKDYLNSMAQTIANLGFKVVRIPMPAPFFASDGFNLFRSYTNSLLLNGIAFVPEYKKPYNELDGVNGEYIDAALTAEYNRTVEKAYLDAGLKVRWIESDSLISKGGAVHCTTMQIAR
jgi:agmatine/peptidylarginine deiminase